ncbi:DUF2510 domain-containing protein [Streptomyces sp. NPDC048295]|uniref:DUF2510 domain-containing protein n=1 Tax=Streptomyces sp. NPDC048295 TaxID=3154617 RepID=UPI003418CA2A
MSDATPPGWYPDAAAPGTERWRDGTGWTAHTRPAGPGPGASARPSRSPPRPATAPPPAAAPGSSRSP